ncbi:hypothetical protein [Microbacterium sp. NIBRBAC000506063]|uniref:hypothetical protein n=1 Tax=Microbacterium sp. NIBRBAC000506063 TaxID=2734618 RepID=UPI001BB5F89A|nr:hypothetical protein [Microbacterium sp. NIBRBAC000506063]QTV79397.1 hypothetical protein KAE78_10650 [Microbacterium sp. NIBRBAC000506063]
MGGVVDAAEQVVVGVGGCRSPVVAEFRGPGGCGQGVDVPSRRAEVSFSLRSVGAGKASTGASEARGVVDTLTFEGVAPGVDVEHVVEPGGVKETVVVAAPPAGVSSWTWVLRADGVSPVLDELGTVNLVDADREIVMHIRHQWRGIPLGGG